MPTIRDFRAADAEQWLRCRLLAFFDSAYYDDVTREKPVYENPSLELVVVEEADSEERIVGPLDLEQELEPGTLCSARPGKRAMVWSIAVLPEFRRQNLATRMLQRATTWAQENGITHLEAWTRDDPWVRTWYESRGFVDFQSYWHVFMDHPQAKEWLTSKAQTLRPNSVFAHVVKGGLKGLPFKPVRSHECIGYELEVSRAD